MSEAQPVVVKKRRWRGWQVTFLVMAILAGSLWSFRVWRQWRMESRLREVIALTEQSDPHWRFAHLLGEYEARPISPTFVKALKAFPPGYRGWCGDDIAERPGAIPYHTDGKHFSVRFPEEYLAILRERLHEERVQPLRQALREYLTEADGHRLPWEGRHVYRDMEKSRWLAYEIADESIYSMHMGDTRQVINAFHMALKNAKLIDRSPSSLHQLLTVSMYFRAYNALKQALAFCQFTNAELVELEKLLVDNQPSPSHEVMRLIRADEFQSLEEAKHDANTQKKIINDLIGFPTANPNWDVQLRDWANRLYIEFAFLNLPDLQVDLLTNIHQTMEFSEQESFSRNHFLKSQTIKSTNPLAKSFNDNVQKLIAARHSHGAHSNTLRLALACERYRLKTGIWPPTLETLVPEYVPNVPLDPFTGKPLLYRVLDNGVVIYSVYFNEVDDGGEVIYSNAGAMRDRGVRLFNPDKRGLKYEP